MGNELSDTLTTMEAGHGAGQHGEYGALGCQLCCRGDRYWAEPLGDGELTYERVYDRGVDRHVYELVLRGGELGETDVCVYGPRHGVPGVRCALRASASLAWNIDGMTVAQVRELQLLLGRVEALMARLDGDAMRVEML